VDAAGNLTAARPGGGTEFTASAPQIWDSAAAGAPASSVAGPGRGARSAMVPSKISRTALTLTRTPWLLSGSARYPVYIQQSISPADFTASSQSIQSNTNGYTEVKSACPGTTFWNNTDEYGKGVGYQDYMTDCDNSSSTLYRAFYQIDTTGLDPSMHVQNATLDTLESFGADFGCKDTTTLYMHWTAAISKNTDWTNQPGYNSRDQLRTASVTPGPNPGRSKCTQQNPQFNVTYAIAGAATGG
jgi:hypothetical protein